MDAVLTGIFGMSLDLLVELGEGIGLGKLQAGISSTRAMTSAGDNARSGPLQ